MLPVISPEAGSDVRPSGRPLTSYFTGLSPVAGIVNKNGDPGLTPNILGPLILGSGPGAGVRITGSSIDVEVILLRFSPPEQDNKTVERMNKTRDFVTGNLFIWSSD